MGSIPTSPMEREGAAWPSGNRIGCWQCGAEHVASLFCPSCEAIQLLPEKADYFQVFGLPRRLVIDVDALQKRYYELQRRVHPDRYQTAVPVARQASLRNTATLNRAYSMLRDPVDRGLYWLALQGESLGANNNRVPPELAELVFDVQEKLEEFRAVRHSNGAAALLATDVRRAHAALLERRAALLAQLDANFVEWDAGTSDGAALRGALKSILSDLAYLGTLIRDVEKELEA